MDFSPGQLAVKVTPKLLRRGQNDVGRLVITGALERVKHPRARAKAEAAERAVDFILCLENIDQISWSAKTLKVDGELVVIPGLARETVSYVCASLLCSLPLLFERCPAFLAEKGRTLEAVQEACRRR